MSQFPEVGNANGTVLINAAATQTEAYALRGGAGLFQIWNEGANDLTKLQVRRSPNTAYCDVVENGVDFTVLAGETRFIRLSDCQVLATVAGSTTIAISRVQDYD